MIKWLVYIALFLIFVPHLSSADIRMSRNIVFSTYFTRPALFTEMLTDSLTLKKHQQQEEEKKKVKEISKAKRQAKPEKIGEIDNTSDQKDKAKPKRERRPEGLERPPEIPRRNGN